MGLLNCSSLACLDLQENKIEGDSDELISILVAMPALACLYLQGNPIVGSFRHYRKRIISEISKLTYLDDRPIFHLERICVEAWARGGVHLEHEARKKFKASEEEKSRRNQEFLLNLREDAYASQKELAFLGRAALRRARIDLTGSSFLKVVQSEPRELFAARLKLSKLSSAS